MVVDFHDPFASDHNKSRLQVPICRKAAHSEPTHLQGLGSLSGSTRSVSEDPFVPTAARQPQLTRKKALVPFSRPTFFS